MAKKAKDIEMMLLDSTEVPYIIPSNWLWCNLEALISKINYGYTESACYEEIGPRFLRITDIKDDGVNWNEVPYCKIDDKKKNNYILEKNDIVIARMGSVGKSYLISDPPIAVYASYLIRIKLNKAVLPKYIDYLNNSLLYWSQITENSKGTTRANVNTKVLKELKIPLPPLEEQQRIVNCIELLFEKIDKAQELIEEAREGFEKRKEAILAKAFRGELTALWREENTCSRSGSDLINDLRMSRESRYKELCEEAKLKKQRKPKVPRFMKEASKELSDELIPMNWRRSYIYEIGDVELGGTPSRKEQSYWGGNIPWLSSGEVANNSISTSRETITTDGLNNSNAKLYPIGTVLIAMIGEGKTRGQSALLEIEACTNQNVAGVIIDNSFISPKYVWYNFIFNYERNRGEGRGGNQPALNGKKVGELTIAIPPYEEQIEIVRGLDKIFDEELKIAELAIEKDAILMIKKAILAKAFRGELDTNDPDEESSLGLLKEILNKRH